MQETQLLSKRVRAAVVFAVVIVALLYLPTVCAAETFAVNVHIDGVKGEDGNGNYNDVARYSIDEPAIATTAGGMPLLTFSIVEGTPAAEILKVVSLHQAADSAQVAVLCLAGGSASLLADYQLSKLRFEQARDEESNATIYPQQPFVHGQPLEEVTLGYKKIVFTYQPLTATCQPAGPATAPVTVQY